MGIYDFEANLIDGTNKPLADYKGKVLLIVNTASKCGFTPQFKQLQELYNKHEHEEFEILGFPCNQFMNQDPGKNEEIQGFCERNYGVTFPMFSKVDVNGENAHPLYAYLTEQIPGMLGLKGIKWNFTKFLVSKDGEVIDRYSPNTNPLDIEPKIEQLLLEKSV